MRNQILNTLHSLGVSSFLRNKKHKKLTVLSLHRISPERNTFWNPIHPTTFEKLLVYVKKHYTIIGFEELEETVLDQLTKPPLVLSFDDGYYDFYEYALPILTKHKLISNHNMVNACANQKMTIWTERLNILFDLAKEKSVSIEVEFEDDKFSLASFGDNWMAFYLATFKKLLETPLTKRLQVIDFLEEELSIDTSRRMMTWEEILDCQNNGTEIGCHTYNHDSLGTLGNRESLQFEIIQSKNEIETKLNKPVSVLALPNGQTGTDANAVIKEAQFKYVLHVNDRLNDFPLSSTNNSSIPINRINLVDEPFQQMALRMELFHNYVRKYV